MTLGNINLSKDLVEAVREAVDVVAIASDQTRLAKKGARWGGLCPLHKEKTPSFSVDPVQGLYYCFGCGAGGDAIDLHMRLSGDDFATAIEALAQRFGVPLPERSAGAKRRGPDLTEVLEAAARYFAAQLERQAVPRRYLDERRISPDLIGAYGLGYAADGWQDLVETLGRRFPMEQLEAAGLVGRSERNPDRPYDRFRHRLMFPIRNPSGRILGFGGRTLGEDKAKYVNTAETEQFKKGLLLYGLDRAKRSIREGGKVLLVEGYFDVLGAAASGIDWSVAGMGTALTPEQARLLGRFAEDVVVGYDGDEAGEKAYRRSLPLLLAEGLTVRRARFGEGEDPDSLRLARGPEAVLAAVEGARDSLTEEIERLTPRSAMSDPRQQAQAARELSDLLRAVPDSILRYGYAKRAADRLDLPVEMLVERLGGGPSRGNASRPVPTSAPPPEAPVSVSEVISLEEKVLTVLLDPQGESLGRQELPAPEVFLDPSCRNIFRVFCDLYEVSGERPEAKDVIAALGSESQEDHARVARCRNAVESSAGFRRLGLRESLDKLEHRWQRTRMRELAREIQQAQRQGDDQRLAELFAEKHQMSRSLHRRM